MMSTTPTDTPTEKRCTGCGEVKTLDEFSRHRRERDGRQARCKACQRAYFAERRKDPTYREGDRAHQAERRASNMARTDEQVAADTARLRPDGLKVCRTCERSLALEEFYVKRREPDGRQPICRACSADRNAAHRAASADRVDALDNYRCAYCACEFTEDNPAEIEHTWPRARADERPDLDVDDLTLWACKECNRGAGGKFANTAHEYAIALYGDRLVEILRAIRPITRRPENSSAVS